MSFFSRIFHKRHESSSNKLSPEPLKTPIVTFPQFAKLPVELQTKIWNYYIALPAPKNQHEHHTRLYLIAYERLPSGFYIEEHLKWTPCVDVAAALRVCRLSRELAIAYCLSLVPEKDIDAPWEEKVHIGDVGHRLPQYSDASTKPSLRSMDDLVAVKGVLPFGIEGMPCVGPATCLGTVRYLIVGDGYLRKNRLTKANAPCSLDN